VTISIIALCQGGKYYLQWLTPPLRDKLLSNKVDIAKGCGHFIQVDHPIFVTEQIRRLVSAASREEADSGLSYH